MLVMTLQMLTNGVKWIYLSELNFKSPHYMILELGKLGELQMEADHFKTIQEKIILGLTLSINKRQSFLFCLLFNTRLH